MKPSRTTRIVAVIFAVISLLFTQLALAAYRCPGAAIPEMAMASGNMQAMPGCDRMDMEQPTLCYAHAHDQLHHQSLDKPDLPQVSSFIAVAPVLFLVVLDAIEPAPATSTVMSFLTRTTAPPLTIQNCCFRI